MDLGVFCNNIIIEPFRFGHCRRAKQQTTERENSFSEKAAEYVMMAEKHKNWVHTGKKLKNGKVYLQRINIRNMHVKLSGKSSPNRICWIYYRTCVLVRPIQRFPADAVEDRARFLKKIRASTSTESFYIKI